MIVSRKLLSGNGFTRLSSRVARAGDTSSRAAVGFRRPNGPLTQLHGQGPRAEAGAARRSPHFDFDAFASGVTP
jgi:hypothetical protein